MFRKYLLPLVAAGMLVFGLIHVITASQARPALEPLAAPPWVPFGETVAGTGLVEASTENIAIGSPLPGVVVEVFVPVDKVGTQVKAGDPLFRVDDRQLKAQLRFQEANLKAAEAQLAKLDATPRPEELPPSAAKVQVAEANVAIQQDLADRATRLQATGGMSQEEIRQRQLALQAARRQLVQAKADYELLKAGAWGPDKAIARAAVAQARAQVEQIKTDLDRTLVRAPVDGEVLRVNVRLGEYVGTPPSQALVVLGNSHKLHVRVDIDEHNIPRFQLGAPAKAMVRGDAQHAIPLRFVRVEPFVVPKKSLTGDNTERVDTRVLQVIYALETKDRPVYVGQQMDVFIQAEPSKRD